MKQLFAWAILLSLTIVMPLYSGGGGGAGITDTQPPSVTHLSPGQGQTFNPYLPKFLWCAGELYSSELRGAAMETILEPPSVWGGFWIQGDA